MEAVVAAKPVIHVAALCGSLRKGSYNRGLLRSAIELSKGMNGLHIEHIDIADLPMLNTDLEGEGTFPPAVEAFRQKIKAADSVLFASPEYNYSVTAPLKNAIDWASRPPNVWGDKAAAIVSAGGGFGGGRAQYHLRQIGVYIDLHFINKPEFFLNAFQPPAKFDSDGNLIDTSAKERLKEVLLSLQEFTLRLQGPATCTRSKKRLRREMAEEALNPVIKVAALCGSLRKGSYHRGLIRAAIQLSEESVKGMQIEYVEIEQLPMFNTDLEDQGTFPPAVEVFRQKIKEADSILFASPEYNFSITAPLKNAIDWAARPPNAWAGKAAAIISTGGKGGGERAKYHLRQVGVFLDLHFVNKPLYCLRAFEPPTKFDKDGNLIDAEAKQSLNDVLLALHALTVRLQGKR